MEKEAVGTKYIKGLFKCRELYQILFENAGDAIFFIEESKIIDCNRAVLLMLGITSKNELIGRFPFDFSPEVQPDGILSNEKAQKIISLITGSSTKILLGISQI